ncbi:uncharacterized protein LOC128559645 [Mercenaria mercenaria]|uniref:uncharacterized protein LOC128559645 n=1 Tax=Mercenaria mercenaria TaxID=6596 RepID=UPI00234F9E45|nr:uncharacterized protein LOC128559645 [Mercenaria mercenaria]
MVKGQDGRPLTMCQLSKSVWNEVCKIKKSDLVKCLRSLNKKHISIEEGGHVSLISVDGGCNITTPRKGWKKKSKTGKHTENNIMIDIEETDNMNENVLSDDHMKEIEGQKASIVNEVDNLFDDTIEYDIEELLEIENQYTKAGTFPRRLENDELKIILQMLNQRRPKKWNSVSVEKLSEIMETNMNVLTKEELLDVAKYLNITLKGTGKEVAVTKVKKSDLVEQLGKLLKSTTKTQTTQRKKTTKNPKRLQDIAAGILIKASYPKQVLNIAYAEYIWPERVKLWKEKNRVAQTIMVKTETEEMNFEPYYVPEFDENSGVFRIFTYDKTHLGTNLRKCMCLDKVRGISIQAWKHVSKARPDILHPSLVEVDDDGRILDQMKESLARSMVSKEVEQEMLEHGFGNEAEFCSVIREGLYVADDVPGISALDRCRKRISLMQWLDKGVDFSQFPPYGGRIKGLSHILYEGLRLSQEAKMYLYALAKSGTYCVRAPNTLCSESFFGTMQEMDPWGQGILSSSGVQKHISDFTTITAMKMDEKRHVYMKTKKDAVYPLPKVVSSQELYTNEEEQKEQEPDEIVQHSGIECHCRQERFIQCIVPRDHFFDSAARARLYKGEKTYKSSVNSGVLRGEQPIRSQYSYKINEARMLPSKRLGIEDKVYQ